MTVRPASLLPGVAIWVLTACGTTGVDLAQREAEVTRAERAFAQTMTDRDHEAFTSHLSDEAVFVSGPNVLRGRAAVAGQWKAYFAGEDAPFSWEPETVVVLASGDLALSSGPVRDPAGKRVFTYNSIWRREGPGVWRIVFDKGERFCE